MTDESVYERAYFPHICNRNTTAINNKLITSTGTGPLYRWDNST